MNYYYQMLHQYDANEPLTYMKLYGSIVLHTVVQSQFPTTSLMEFLDELELQLSNYVIEIWQLQFRVLGLHSSLFLDT